MSARIKNLHNKRLLADLLGFQLSVLEQMIAEPELHYRKRIHQGRELEVPRSALKRVHKAIKELLAELPLPAYVHSGRKGRSYLSNALVHLHANGYAKMDIRKFYKSCKREHVFRFFKYDMNASDDVAWLLTDLAMYGGFLPTGSPLSQLLAYWAYHRTFDKINEIAVDAGLVHSQYVDDLTFSGKAPKLPKHFYLQVNHVLRLSGLSLKRSKFRIQRRTDKFEVTGVIVGNGAREAPNRLKGRLFKLLDAVDGCVDDLDLKTFRSALGTLRSIRVLEPNRFPKLYSAFRNREIRLVREARQRKRATG